MRGPAAGAPIGESVHRSSMEGGDPNAALESERDRGRA